MFDQGSQIVQLVKQVGTGTGQAQNIQNQSIPVSGAEGPDPVDAARFGNIVKTSSPEQSALIDFKNNAMLGKENLSGRTVLFPTSGIEQAVGSSGFMGVAVKDAWKKLRDKMGQFDDSINNISGDGEMSYQDTVMMSKKLVHLEAGFHLTFTSLQKATQSFDTLLRAQ